MKLYERIVNNFCSHYNDKKYWKMKFRLNNKKIPKILRAYFLLRMKKMEAFNCASLGNRLYGGSFFAGKPKLPHGIKGIFITDTSKIGKDVTILQQVTIGLKDFSGGVGPVIGNNVTIGTGAKIIGPIVIGNNVKIGANCIVVEDIPDNATVVMCKPRIIIKEKNENEKNKNII